MNSQDRTISFSAAELNRLHDQARQQAVTLRHEAIDEFWSGLHAALWAALARTRRAATRLQHHQPLHSSAASR